MDRTQLDKRVPRVSKMLDLYYEPLWLGEDVEDCKDVHLFSWFKEPVYYARME